MSQISMICLPEEEISPCAFITPEKENMWDSTFDLQLHKALVIMLSRICQFNLGPLVCRLKKKKKCLGLRVI